MNSQEIISAKEAYVTIKLMAEGKLEELNSQLAQLAEAEKPKRRHGDFGLSKKPERYPRLTLETLEGKFFAAGKYACEEIMDEDEKQGYPDPVFGNIFDLMKDWGKDLEHLAITPEYGGTIDFHPSLVKHKVIHVFTNSTHLSLKEAEEIWRKLGQMIMTRKRKQS